MRLLQVFLSPFNTMALNPSGPTGSTTTSSMPATSFAELPYGSEARHTALSQALLQALTEGSAEDSQSSIGCFSDAEFREQLADFIELTNNELNTLKERIARLEALIDR